MALSELRRDYIVERFVLVPSDDNYSKRQQHECHYCPGNEHMNPAVLALVQRDGIFKMLSDDDDDFITDWSIRVLQESMIEGSEDSSYGDQMLYRESVNGYHYVIVATRDHNQRLSALPKEQWADVLLVLQDRLNWLYSMRKVGYVSVFASQGNDNKHPCIDIVTLPNVPPAIAQEYKAAYRFMNNNGSCPICDIVNLESKGPREVLATKDFVAISPWAPTHPYEFWIVPKKHSSSFLSVTQTELKDLALMLRSTLGGLCRAIGDMRFNMAFHLAPEKRSGTSIHWHIEVYPQISNWSGFERAFGIYINNVSPEQAGAVLSPACKRELAEMIGITV